MQKFRTFVRNFLGGIFSSMQRDATVMIVKDQVLAHNPVAALYTANGMYSRFKDILQR